MLCLVVQVSFAKYGPGVAKRLQRITDRRLCRHPKGRWGIRLSIKRFLVPLTSQPLASSLLPLQPPILRMSTSLLAQEVLWDPLPGSPRLSPRAEFPYPTCSPQPTELSHWHCTSYVLNGGYWPSLPRRPELLSKRQETMKHVARIRLYLEEDAQLFSGAELAEMEATIESIEKRLELNSDLDAVKNLLLETRKLAKRMITRSIEAWLKPLDVACVAGDVLLEAADFP